MHLVVRAGPFWVAALLVAAGEVLAPQAPRREGLGIRRALAPLLGSLALRTVVRLRVSWLRC